MYLYSVEGVLVSQPPTALHSPSPFPPRQEGERGGGNGVGGSLTAQPGLGVAEFLTMAIAASAITCIKWA